MGRYGEMRGDVESALLDLEIWGGIWGDTGRCGTFEKAERALVLHNRQRTPAAFAVRWRQDPDPKLGLAEDPQQHRRPLLRRGVISEWERSHVG